MLMSELEIPLAHIIMRCRPQRCIFMYNLLLAETEVRMLMVIIVLLALLCFALLCYLLVEGGNEEGYGECGT